MKRTCINCRKRGTFECPPSRDCFSLNHKPYFETKRIKGVKTIIIEHILDKFKK